MWTSEVDVVGRRHAVLPDGCIDLLFSAGDAGSALDVIGTMTRAEWHGGAGPMRFAGVRFEPGGAVPFLREAGHALTDRSPSARAVLGAPAAALRARLAEAPDLDSAVDTLENFLLARAANVSGVDRRIAWAATELSRHCQPRVDAVAAELGLSRQHLRRLFREHIGLSTKAYARVARVQRLLEITAGGVALADAALAAGFADQAHMSNEFKRLVGMSPAKFHSYKNAT